MKYLNNYNRFMKSLEKEINKSSSKLESKLISDLSENFWELSLKSKIFDEEDKIFISENLMNYKVDMLNESWFSDLWDDAKDLWKKGKKWVKEKIQQIIDNVSAFAKSAIEFIKKIITGIKDYLKKTYTSLVNKNKDKIQEDLKKDPEKLKKEGSEFKETLDWMSKNFMSKLFGKIDENESNIESNISTVKESILYFGDDVDILHEFYIMNEGSGGIDANDPKQVHDVTNSKDVKEFAGSFIMKWIIGMNAKKPVDGDKKTKVVWWVSLIGKIIGWVLNPVVKVIEAGIKLASSKILQAGSFVASVLGGPGIYKFIFIGGAVAALTGAAIEASHVWHSHVLNFIPGFESLIESGFLETVMELIGEATGINGIATVLMYVCFILSISSLVIEVYELYLDIKGKDTLESPDGLRLFPSVGR